MAAAMALLDTLLQQLEALITQQQAVSPLGIRETLKELRGLDSSELQDDAASKVAWACCMLAFHGEMGWKEATPAQLELLQGTARCVGSVLYCFQLAAEPERRFKMPFLTAPPHPPPYIFPRLVP